MGVMLSFIIILYMVFHFNSAIILCVLYLKDLKSKIRGEYFMINAWSFDSEDLLLDIIIQDAYLITLITMELVSMSFVRKEEYLKNLL